MSCTIDYWKNMILTAGVFQDTAKSKTTYASVAAVNMSSRLKFYSAKNAEIQYAPDNPLS